MILCDVAVWSHAGISVLSSIVLAVIKVELVSSIAMQTMQTLKDSQSLHV